MQFIYVYVCVYINLYMYRVLHFNRPRRITREGDVELKKVSDKHRSYMTSERAQDGTMSLTLNNIVKIKDRIF